MLFRTPAVLARLYPGLVWRIPTAEKNIYLTFDDGPTPGPTDFVLSLLERYHAKATFFCTGENIVAHPELFERIKDAQHKVGNHTYDHMEGWGHSAQAYFENIQRCQAVIKKTSLFRPPYGKITRKQIKILSAYRIIMWDVLSFDFLRLLSPEKCLRGIVKATRPGSIVVFHDSHKAMKNLRFILPRYLDYFKEKGFAFREISGLN